MVPALTSCLLPLWHTSPHRVAHLANARSFTVEYEPEGHTVPPHEAPQIAFGDFARFVLRLNMSAAPQPAPIGPPVKSSCRAENKNCKAPWAQMRCEMDADCATVDGRPVSCGHQPVLCKAGLCESQVYKCAVCAGGMAPLCTCDSRTDAPSGAGCDEQA